MSTHSGFVIIDGCVLHSTTCSSWTLHRLVAEYPPKGEKNILPQLLRNLRLSIDWASLGQKHHARATETDKGDPFELFFRSLPLTPLWKSTRHRERPGPFVTRLCSWYDWRTVHACDRDLARSSAVVPPHASHPWTVWTAVFAVLREMLGICPGEGRRGAPCQTVRTTLGSE